MVNKRAVDIHLKSKWVEIYADLFDQEVNFIDLVIPEIYSPSKYFAVIVAKRMTIDKIVTAMRREFDVNLFVEDLDKIITVNDRVADKNYVVLFEVNFEANENKDLKKISASTLDRKNIKGITLLERLLLDVYCHSRYQGCHVLDANCGTMCSGSRLSVYSGGGVPCVSWNSLNSELNVSWVPVNNSGNNTSRAVIYST